MTDRSSCPPGEVKNPLFDPDDVIRMAIKRAFEPGCSIGVLTKILAISVSRWRQWTSRPLRCREHANDAGRLAMLPSHTAHSLEQRGMARSILSCKRECGYYFDAVALTSLGATLVGRLEGEGAFLAAHWLGASPDHLLSGDQVHGILAAVPGFAHVASQWHEGFHIDKWTRQFQAIYSKERLAKWEDASHTPANDKVCDQAVWFTQNMLIGPKRDMDQIIEAVRKIQKHAGELMKA